MRGRGDMVKEDWKYISVRIKALMAAMAVLMGIMVLLIFRISREAPGLRVAAGIVSGLFLLLVYLAYQLVFRPWKENQRVKDLFAQGYVFSDIFELEYPESREDTAVYRRFREMIDTRELITVSKKQAEYLALQNQINPHFLYNTLEGIRSEALLAGVDSIAEMTEALATFFRYTISHIDHLVTLEDELANIENYYYIQQFRFGDKLQLAIEYEHDEDMDETEILKYRMPKLTLQPIVENSIYHGIERKIGKGHLKIKIYAVKDRLIIRVSDDGMGIQEEKLKELNDKLKSLSLDDVNPKSEKKGGIAILNVNNRIKLLFGEEYGIYVYSHQDVGTDVEISLPVVTG